MSLGNFTTTIPEPPAAPDDGAAAPPPPPPPPPKLAVPATGLSIGIDHYGASAPGKDLANEFGFTVDKIENRIREHLSNLL